MAFCAKETGQDADIESNTLNANKKGSYLK